MVEGLVGIPFLNRGRNVKEGLDCWGLVMEVFRRRGIILPDFDVDSFAFQAIDALAGEEVGYRTWEEVYRPLDTDAPLVVLMRMHPVYVTHAGAFLGFNRILHTTKATGSILSRADALAGHIKGYYRYVDGNKHT